MGYPLHSGHHNGRGCSESTATTYGGYLSEGDILLNANANSRSFACIRGPYHPRAFAAGVERAAEIGFRWVEPMVHNGRELLSEAGYFHSFSMDDDPYLMKDILDSHGVKPSGLSSHCPLMRPEISVPYLQKAIRFAAAIGAPVVNTDEGIRPSWMDLDDCYAVMRYTLTEVLQTAERYRIFVGIEPHQSISRTTEGLLSIATLVESPMLRVNYDTGNAYLAGESPYEGLKAVSHLLVHVHAKDISVQMADAEKGKVTGTPVGCACGDGVIDWRKVTAILHESGFNGVLSVECGSAAQAARSLAHLTQVLSEAQTARIAVPEPAAG